MKAISYAIPQKTEEIEASVLYSYADVYLFMLRKHPQVNVL